MKKIISIIRFILFLFSIFLVFTLIGNINKVGLFGYIFLILEFVYIITNLLIILNKKTFFFEDVPFNLMQIGMYIYMTVITFRTYSIKTYGDYKETLIYFRNNYMILSILIITLLFYILLMTLELKKVKKK